MDFFAQQDAARRKTSVLLAYYALALAAIIAAIYAVVVGLLHWETLSRQVNGGPSWWHPQIFAIVAGGTLTLVLVGSLYKLLSLRRGGAVVAEALGGRLVSASPTDAAERRLRNVVEEMAIASGIPVPSIYVLEEETGINAFAAGLDTTDAVVAVTRGCLNTLTRDELQGVVAHEFSHILNGDMRLNLRLIALLHGILVIALTGYTLLRLLGRGRMRGSRSSSGKGGRGGLLLAIVALGVGLLVIGYVGVFFANLIKSAVSRQREFLADASAVQFTRNPLGLAGALKRIGGATRGSRVRHARAQESSHLFFANGLRNWPLALLATHPPLEVRVKRLDPSFTGRFPPATARAADAPARVPAAVAGLAATEVPAHADHILADLGAPRPEHLAYAQAALAHLPTPITDAAREPFGARAVIYALLLEEADAVRARQLEHLRKAADPAVYAETERLAPIVRTQDRAIRLPIVDVAIAALRELSRTQYDAFRHNVNALIEADDRVSLFEFALQRVLLRHLDVHHGARRRDSAPRQRKLIPLLPHCATLFAALAAFGHEDGEAAAEAYDQAVRELGPRQTPEFADVKQRSRQRIEEALTALNRATPRIKKQVLRACIAAVQHDNHIRVAEAELLRAIADSLGCPMPPLLPLHGGRRAAR